MPLTQVSTGMIADNAVTAAKVADGGITPAKLSTGAPTWDAGGAVTLASNNVNSASGSDFIANANGANRDVFLKVNGTTVATAEGSTGNFKINSGYGSVATAYGCRAWVNFNGTGTVAIRASGNISSISDFGVGDYGFSIATAMPDSNYAVVASACKSAGPPSNTNSALVTIGEGPTTTTSSVGIVQADGTTVDKPYVYIALFR